MTAERVLITGAHGFIGRHTARRLASQGYTVAGLGHGTWKADEWQSWGLSDWHEADVSSESLRQYAQPSSVIVHCAGSGSVAFSIENPLPDFHRTVTTTMSVLEYVRTESRNTRVVYPSSAGVYGIADALPIREDARRAPVSPYGVHKSVAEQLISCYGSQFGISACIIRFFSVYGCGLRKQLLWDGCRKLASGDNVFMGTGKEVRDWLHVDDAADLLSVAIEHASPLCPVANGGTGEGVSVCELLTHIASCLQLDGKAPLFSTDQRIGDPFAYVADTTEARRWGWKPSIHWRDRVSEYVAWWRLEMGLAQPGAMESVD